MTGRGGRGEFEFVMSGTPEEIEAEMAKVRDEALAHGSALGLYKLMPDGSISFCHVTPFRKTPPRDGAEAGE